MGSSEEKGKKRAGGGVTLPVWNMKGMNIADGSKEGVGV